MSSTNTQFSNSNRSEKHITLLTGPSGRSRRNELTKRLQEASGPGVRTFLVPCGFDEGGPWSGPASLISSLYEELQSERPDLTNKHSLELIYVMPRLRRVLPNQNPTLTDLASSEERVRSYPVDRAYRIIHGLIDLIAEWKTTKKDHDVWMIACEGLDDAGAMTRHFFRELLRRRGQALHLELLATASADKAGDIAALFAHAGQTTQQISLDIQPDLELPLPYITAEAEARRIEAQIAEDRIETAVHLPKLIRLWSQANRFDMVLKYRVFGMDFYNTLGLYEDSLRYGEGLIEMSYQYDPENEFRRWAIASKLLNIYLGLVDVPTALKFTERMIDEFAQKDQFRLAVMYYTMAMLYGRYQKPRDFAKGEECLERGLAALNRAHLEGTISDREFAFQSVFNRNGLAMIRNFQRRHDEAIEICRECMEALNTHLSGDEHVLHRSVLLFNIGQVYNAIELYSETIDYYTAAIKMDPNYSEYYNDRGSAYLHAGRLEEAEKDYLTALKLSPPYFEVLTNLGQCYRRKGEMGNAIASYSRALDIEPAQTLALLGRAKSYEEVGNIPAAISDYSSAILLDGSLWEAFASRGILNFELGEFEASLSDLNRAIALKPNMGDLYENRAVLLAKMGHTDRAREDAKLAVAHAREEHERLALQSHLEQLFPAGTNA